MYTIYLVWNGNKRQVASKYVYDSKLEWELDRQALPYDVVDEDEHNVWFDFGDV